MSGEQNLSAVECDHSMSIGTWVEGEEIARRCADCGVPLDEDGYPAEDEAMCLLLCEKEGTR